MLTKNDNRDGRAIGLAPWREDSGSKMRNGDYSHGGVAMSRGIPNRNPSGQPSVPAGIIHGRQKADRNGLCNTKGTIL